MRSRIVSSPKSTLSALPSRYRISLATQLSIIFCNSASEGTRSLSSSKLSMKDCRSAFVTVITRSSFPGGCSMRSAAKTSAPSTTNHRRGSRHSERATVRCAASEGVVPPIPAPDAVCEGAPTTGDISRLGLSDVIGCVLDTRSSALCNGSREAVTSKSNPSAKNLDRLTRIHACHKSIVNSLRFACLLDLLKVLGWELLDAIVCQTIVADRSIGLIGAARYRNGE